jgi:HK97 family phage portal protein
MELLSFLNRPREAHQISSKDTQLLSRLLAVDNGRELAEPLDFNRLAEEGYRINPLIYGCIRFISQAVADPTLKALTVDAEERVKTDTVVASDPLAKLLMKPNHVQDQFEFYEQLLIHLMFAGNAFIHKVRAASGQVVELELVRPDVMGIVPGQTRKEGKIKNYTVKINEESFPIPADDIIHFKLPDALDEFWGLSPIFVLARYGDVDVQSADFLRSYFLNKGIPAGILTFEHPVQKPERERIRDMWKDQYNALEGWHNIAVLDAKVQYQNIQTGIKDVDMDVITNQTETRICAVYGVPPILISALAGISHATFANVEESRKLFWMDTATPLFTRLSKKLTTELAMKEFGDDRRIVFDLTGVPALQENKSEIRKIAMQGWNSGLFTRDQAFTLLGHAQESEQGNLIKILPGTEFRPIEDQATASDTDNLVPQAGGATVGTQQNIEPKEIFKAVDVGMSPLEAAFVAAFDIAIAKFAHGECPWPDDDPRCANFAFAVEDEDEGTVLDLLRLDRKDFGLMIGPIIKSHSLALQDGRESIFTLDVTPSINQTFGRLEEASSSSIRIVMGSDLVPDKQSLLFKTVGLLPSQAMSLVMADVQFAKQGRTDDERNVAVGRLRGVFLDRHRDAFAAESAALVDRELKEQIALKEIIDGT